MLMKPTNEKLKETKGRVKITQGRTENAQGFRDMADTTGTEMGQNPVQGFKEQTRI